MKKGFTLIELLAVIVILAIIALIATPMITNVINTAREGAAKSSALGYVDAIEKQIMLNQVSGDTPFDLTIVKDYDKDYYTSMGVEVKGEVGILRATIDTSGSVIKACIQANDKIVYYEDSLAIIDIDGKCVPDTNAGIMYYGS